MDLKFLEVKSLPYIYNIYTRDGLTYGKDFLQKILFEHKNHCQIPLYFEIEYI